MLPGWKWTLVLDIVHKAGVAVSDQSLSTPAFGFQAQYFIGKCIYFPFR